MLFDQVDALAARHVPKSCNESASLPPNLHSVPAYPTPSNAVVNIRIEPTSVGMVSVSTLDDQRVKVDWKFTDTGIAINTETLPAGAYMVGILYPWSSAVAGTAKILVQH